MNQQYQRRVWKPGLLILLMLAVSACEGISPLSAQAGIPLNGTNPVEVRTCEYIPGVSTPAHIPPEMIAADTQLPKLKTYSFSISLVETSVTEQQLQVFSQILEDIQESSFTLDLTDQDVKTIRQKYEPLILKGLSLDDFYQAIKQMLVDLDGGLSQFWTPSEAAKYAVDNAGIGVAGSPALVDGQQAFIILQVFPNSPASLAGLKNRDVILTVDGEPAVDEYRQPRIYGPVDNGVILSVRSPDSPVVEVDLARSPANNSIDPIDACLVSGTRLGYIHLIGYADRNAIDQMEEALKGMSAAGPVQGLVLDTRMNTGGDPEILEELLAVFTGGELGSFISPGNAHPLNILPRDVAGSQSLRLVILQDETSRLIGDAFVGTLQSTGRARTVGSTIPGPFYRYRSFNLPDHSRLSVPSQAFQPAGKPVGYFDQYGIAPDVSVPARWDLFTEATDPVLAKAIQILQDPWDGSSYM